MLKKIIVILAMLALIGLSIVLARKTPNNHETVTVSENQEQPIPEETLPNEIYTWNTQNLTEECSFDKQMLCAVETAIKCTIKPDGKDCKTVNLPKFIFMTEQSVNRPTEIAYKFTNKKPLPNNTVEIYTESSCNGTWFGLCQGTVIYVLSPNEKNTDTWYVRDIYAVE